MVSMKALKSGLQQLRDKRYIMALAADQNPSVVEVADWHPFMNREAPFFRGPENLARRAKAVVFFAGIRKVRRGYYHMHLERVWDDASASAPGEITRAYVAFMEKTLHAQPENYLWSHRRWKHKRKVEA
jgi:KDO2-lipid IV(A) lauroyltransferase